MSPIQKNHFHLKLIPLLAFAFAPALGASGCVDAPITSAHLRPDGSLRDQAFGQNLRHAGGMNPTIQQAASFELRGQLTTQENIGDTLKKQAPGEDQPEPQTNIHADKGQLYLYLEVEQLDRPRSVTLVWTHEDSTVELTDSILEPKDSPVRIASFDLAQRPAGNWAVDVFENSEFGSIPLYHHDFQLSPVR